MYKHLALLYLLFSMLSGATVLSILIFYALKEKNRVLNHYLLFFCLFSIKVFSWIIGVYCENLGLDYPELLFFFLSELSINSIIFALPLFFHSFFNVSFKKYANRIFFLLAFFSILIDIDIHFSRIYKINPEVSTIIFGAALVLVILYCLIIGIVFYKKLKLKIQKKIARSILILCIIFLPGFIYDSLLIYGNQILMTPLFYIIWNGFTIYYAMKYYLLSYEKLSLSQEFIDKFELSNRETEILKLLLQGLTNKDISEKAYISVATVKTHIHNIYKKTGAKNRHNLVIIINQYQKKDLSVNELKQEYK